ncbi:MAG: VTT domain-containing protein, partial [Planctomycetota bacterium]
GEGDFLVPVAAAREHARIVPQAELVVLPEPAHHFLPWEQAPEVLGHIDAFLDRADAGAAPVRSTAAPERLARANEPFDPASVPPFEGPALFTVLLLLAVATLVSEDLACIGAGLLVADGRLSWVAGSAACFVGIFVGDMLLYLLGRAFGRAALHRRPLSWIASEEAVERASRWFDRKGIAVIFLSRFTPGLRLPTYVAAGVLRTSFVRFALFFAVAGLIWTPALVGIAALAGEQLAHALGGLGARQMPWFVALVLGLLLLYRNLPLVFTHRGRRILRGRWLRLTRWEFWPPWITYLPVLPHVAWLGVRHGGLAKCTAANPALPAGGFVGESKSAILEGLGPEHPEIPDFALLRASDGPHARAERARAFVDADGHLPVVLKPDAGQRGSGVALLDRADDAVRHARELEHDAILQQVVHGPEFGVFWVREPGAERGRVFSVTVKQLPEVVGDGRRTVEELLLDDPRACAMHGAYLAELGQDAEAVLPEGEVRRLVEVGTHARGAIFLDGEHLRTPALEEAVERIASRFEGFHFGRFDVIAPSEEAFAEGVGLRVIELNGVTSESTNVYDPKFSVLAAYRTLWAQWTLAYRIGAANAALGAPTVGLLGILQELRKYRKGQAQHLKLPHEILSRP